MFSFALKFAVAVLVTGLLLAGHVFAQSNTTKYEAFAWINAEESGTSEQYQNYLE